VAAPVYLAKRSELSPKALLIAAGTVPVIGAVFFMSLVPVPDAPWRYLPYIFAGLLAAGMIVSACVQHGRTDGTAQTAPSPKHAG